MAYSSRSSFQHVANVLTGPDVLRSFLGVYKRVGFTPSGVKRDELHELADKKIVQDILELGTNDVIAIRKLASSGTYEKVNLPLKEVQKIWKRASHETRRFVEFLFVGPFKYVEEKLERFRETGAFSEEAFGMFLDKHPDVSKKMLFGDYSIYKYLTEKSIAGHLNTQVRVENVSSIDQIKDAYDVVIASKIGTDTPSLTNLNHAIKFIQKITPAWDSLKMASSSQDPKESGYSVPYTGHTPTPEEIASVYSGNYMMVPSNYPEAKGDIYGLIANVPNYSSLRKDAKLRASNYLANNRKLFNSMLGESCMLITNAIEKAKDTRAAIPLRGGDATIAPYLNRVSTELYNSYENVRSRELGAKLNFIVHAMIPMVTSLNARIAADVGHQRLGEIGKQLENAGLGIFNMKGGDLTSPATTVAASPVPAPSAVAAAPAPVVKQAEPVVIYKESPPIVITKYEFLNGGEKNDFRENAAQVIAQMVDAQDKFNKTFSENYRKLIQDVDALEFSDVYKDRLNTYYGIVTIIRSITIADSKTTVYLSGLYGKRNYNNLYLETVEGAIEELKKIGLGQLSPIIEDLTKIKAAVKAVGETAQQLSTKFATSKNATPDLLRNGEKRIKIRCDLNASDFNAMNEALQRIYWKINNQTSESDIRNQKDELKGYLDKMQDRNKVIDEYFNRKLLDLEFEVRNIAPTCQYKNDYITAKRSMIARKKDLYKYINTTFDSEITRQRLRNIDDKVLDAKQIKNLERSFLLFKKSRISSRFHDECEKFAKMLQSPEKSIFRMTEYLRKIVAHSHYIEFIESLYRELGIFDKSFDWKKFRDTILDFICVNSFDVDFVYKFDEKYIAWQEKFGETDYPTMPAIPGGPAGTREKPGIEEYEAITAMFVHAVRDREGKITAFTKPIDGSAIAVGDLSTYRIFEGVDDKQFGSFAEFRDRPVNGVGAFLRYADPEDRESRFIEMVFDSLVYNVVRIIDKYWQIRYHGTEDLPMNLRGGAFLSPGNVFDAKTLHDHTNSEVIVEAVPFYICALNCAEYYLKESAARPDIHDGTKAKRVIKLSKISSLYPLARIFVSSNVDLDGYDGSVKTLSIQQLNTALSVLNAIWKRTTGTNMHKLSAAIDMFMSELNTCIYLTDDVHMTMLRNNFDTTTDVNMKMFEQLNDSLKIMQRAIIASRMDDYSWKDPSVAQTKFESMLKQGMEKINKTDPSARMSELRNLLRDSNHDADAQYSEYFRFMDGIIAPMITTFKSYKSIFALFDSVASEMSVTNASTQYVDLEHKYFCWDKTAKAVIHDLGAIAPADPRYVMINVWDYINGKVPMEGKDPIIPVKNRIMNIAIFADSPVVKEWNQILFNKMVYEYTEKNRMAIPVFWNVNDMETYPTSPVVEFKPKEKVNVANVPNVNILRQIYPNIRAKTLGDFFEVALHDYVNDVDEIVHLMMSYPGIGAETIRKLEKELHDHFTFEKVIKENNELYKRLREIAIAKDIMFKPPGWTEASITIPEFVTPGGRAVPPLEIGPGYDGSAMDGMPNLRINKNASIARKGLDLSVNPGAGKSNNFTADFSKFADVETFHNSYIDRILYLLASCNPSEWTVPFKLAQLILNNPVLNRFAKPILLSTDAAITYDGNVSPITQNIMARSTTEVNANREYFDYSPQTIAGLISIIPYLINMATTLANATASNISYRGMYIVEECKSIADILVTFYGEISAYAQPIGFLQRNVLTADSDRDHVMGELCSYADKSLDDVTNAIAMEWGNRYAFAHLTNITFPDFKNRDKFEWIKTFESDKLKSPVFAKNYNIILENNARLVWSAMIANSARKEVTDISESPNYTKNAEKFRLAMTLYAMYTGAKRPVTTLADWVGAVFGVSPSGVLTGGDVTYREVEKMDPTLFENLAKAFTSHNLVEGVGVTNMTDVDAAANFKKLLSYMDVVKNKDLFKAMIVEKLVNRKFDFILNLLRGNIYGPDTTPATDNHPNILNTFNAIAAAGTGASTALYTAPPAPPAPLDAATINSMNLNKFLVIIALYAPIHFLENSVNFLRLVHNFNDASIDTALTGGGALRLSADHADIALTYLEKLCVKLAATNRYMSAGDTFDYRDDGHAIDMNKKPVVEDKYIDMGRQLESIGILSGGFGSLNTLMSIFASGKYKNYVQGYYLYDMSKFSLGADHTKLLLKNVPPLAFKHVFTKMKADPDFANEFVNRNTLVADTDRAIGKVIELPMGNTTTTRARLSVESKREMIIDLLINKLFDEASKGGAGGDKFADYLSVISDGTDISTAHDNKESFEADVGPAVNDTILTYFAKLGRDKLGTDEYGEMVNDYVDKLRCCAFIHQMSDHYASLGFAAVCAIVYGVRYLTTNGVAYNNVAFIANIRAGITAAGGDPTQAPWDTICNIGDVDWATDYKSLMNNANEILGGSGGLVIGMTLLAALSAAGDILGANASDVDDVVKLLSVINGTAKIGNGAGGAIIQIITDIHGVAELADLYTVDSANAYLNLDAVVGAFDACHAVPDSLASKIDIINDTCEHAIIDAATAAARAGGADVLYKTLVAALKAACGFANTKGKYRNLVKSLHFNRHLTPNTGVSSPDIEATSNANNLETAATRLMAATYDTHDVCLAGFEEALILWVLLNFKINATAGNLDNRMGNINTDAWKKKIGVSPVVIDSIFGATINGAANKDNITTALRSMIERCKYINEKRRKYINNRIRETVDDWIVLNQMTEAAVIGGAAEGFLHLITTPTGGGGVNALGAGGVTFNAVTGAGAPGNTAYTNAGVRAVPNNTAKYLCNIIAALVIGTQTDAVSKPYGLNQLISYFTSAAAAGTVAAIQGANGGNAEKLRCLIAGAAGGATAEAWSIHNTYEGTRYNGPSAVRVINSLYKFVMLASLAADIDISTDGIIALADLIAGNADSEEQARNDVKFFMMMLFHTLVDKRRQSPALSMISTYLKQKHGRRNYSIIGVGDSTSLFNVKYDDAAHTTMVNLTDTIVAGVPAGGGAATTMKATIGTATLATNLKAATDVSGAGAVHYAEHRGDGHGVVTAYLYALLLTTRRKELQAFLPGRNIFMVNINNKVIPVGSYFIKKVADSDSVYYKLTDGGILVKDSECGDNTDGDNKYTRKALKAAYMRDIYNSDPNIREDIRNEVSTKLKVYGNNHTIANLDITDDELAAIKTIHDHIGVKNFGSITVNMQRPGAGAALPAGNLLDELLSPGSIYDDGDKCTAQLYKLLFTNTGADKGVSSLLNTASGDAIPVLGPRDAATLASVLPGGLPNIDAFKPSADRHPYTLNTDGSYYVGNHKYTTDDLYAAKIIMESNNYVLPTEGFKLLSRPTGWFNKINADSILSSGAKGDVKSAIGAIMHAYGLVGAIKAFHRDSVEDDIRGDSGILGGYKTDDNMDWHLNYAMWYYFYSLCAFIRKAGAVKVDKFLETLDNTNFQHPEDAIALTNSIIVDRNSAGDQFNKKDLYEVPMSIEGYIVRHSTVATYTGDHNTYIPAGLFDDEVRAYLEDENNDGPFSSLKKTGTAVSVVNFNAKFANFKYRPINIYSAHVNDGGNVPWETSYLTESIVSKIATRLGLKDAKDADIIRPLIVKISEFIVTGDHRGQDYAALMHDGATDNDLSHVIGAPISGAADAPLKAAIEKIGIVVDGDEANTRRNMLGNTNFKSIILSFAPATITTAAPAGALAKMTTMEVEHSVRMVNQAVRNLIESMSEQCFDNFHETVQGLKKDGLLLKGGDLVQYTKIIQYLTFAAKPADALRELYANSLIGRKMFEQIFGKNHDWKLSDNKKIFVATINYFHKDTLDISMLVEKMVYAPMFMNVANFRMAAAKIREIVDDIEKSGSPIGEQLKLVIAYVKNFSVEREANLDLAVDKFKPDYTVPRAAAPPGTLGTVLPMPAAPDTAVAIEELKDGKYGSLVKLPHANPNFVYAFLNEEVARETIGNSSAMASLFRVDALCTYLECLIAIMRRTSYYDHEHDAELPFVVGVGDFDQFTAL